MKRLEQSFFFLLILVSSSMLLFAQPERRPAAAAWKGWEFLVGQWSGEGSGRPGQASGGFTFTYDLDSTVLVRKSHADYPSLKGRPAFTHSDVLTVYHEGKSAKAIYFDNEGHVIHYDVMIAPDSSSWVFLSDVKAKEPRFKFVYTRAGDGQLAMSFEVAPPGHPDDFEPYVTSTATRKK